MNKTDTLEVKLVHPGDSLEDDEPRVFYLSVHTPEIQNSVNVAVQSIVSSAGSLAGGIPYPSSKKVILEGVIQGTDPEQYPNSSTYNDHAYGMSRELEKASTTWGPEFTETATLHYDGRVYDGVITDFTLTENRREKPGRMYDFSLEFTSIDVYSRG